MEGEYQGICCLFSERAGQEPNSLYTQDSTGHIGFQFKEGKITSIVVDSSAARSLLLGTVWQKKTRFPIFMFFSSAAAVEMF